MSLRRTVLLITTTAVTATIMGCAGNGTLLIDETYSVLEPVKQLELPEQNEPNLVIRISNVADESTSYKNRLELYINDRMIEPNWLVSNVQNTFTYNIKLKPGYYNVKAYYYAYIGWGDDKFRIEAQDLVRVTPTTRTTLSCAIAKKPNGIPVNEKMYFEESSESLITEATTESSISIEPVVPKSESNEVSKPIVPKTRTKKVIRRRQATEHYW